MARKPLLESGSLLSTQDVPDLQARIIQKDAERNGRTPATPVVPTVQTVQQDIVAVDDVSTPPADDRSYDKQYDDMTNQSYDRSYNGSHDKSYDDMTKKSYDKASGRVADNTVGLSSTQQSILAALKQGGKSEPTLKTVTFKLSPSLDEKVEEHMRETGRKKQDIVRDALHLYFETVEQANRAAGGD
ncbi:MAG: hypothetical protein EOP06_24445 [Proteobacteria bacterium]|nr:MAG: hypothetical protein EOP06_24445 [Pseudomonadota bacterium]